MFSLQRLCEQRVSESSITVILVSVRSNMYGPAHVYYLSLLKGRNSWIARFESGFLVQVDPPYHPVVVTDDK